MPGGVAVLDDAVPAQVAHGTGQEAGQETGHGTGPGGGRRLGCATYPPQLHEVRRARAFVEDRMGAAGLSCWADDAGLLVCELASNAVLHARTDFDVHVYALDAGARVEVHDRCSTPPVLTAPSATATSGRGLLLVRDLAVHWGTDTVLGTGKSVWFTVAGAVPAPRDEPSVEDLLALWADPPDRPDRHAADGARAVVPDLPVPELLAGEEDVDDALREVQLVLLAPAAPGQERASRPGAPTPREVAVAQALDAAARAFGAGRAQVREQVTRAAAGGHERVTVDLRLDEGAAGTAVRYRQAVHDAEGLAQEGSSLPAFSALARHGRLRRRYLDEVVGQLGRERPGPPAT